VVRIHVRPPAICSELAIFTLRPDFVLQPFVAPMSTPQLASAALSPASPLAARSMVAVSISERNRISVRVGHNLHFIKTLQAAYRDQSIPQITRDIADLCDIIYLSARKLGCVRGGGICMKSEEMYRKMRSLVSLYEGFLTYGGMSVREIEALTMGLDETMDEDMISQFLKEPPILRFFCGTRKPASGRQETLVAKFREDFGDSLQGPLLGVEQSLVLVRLEELVANRALKGLAEGDDGGEAGLPGRRGELRVRAELPDAHRADREPAASYSPCEIE